jgi:antitoxin (DNA-binding transcriptional repressor) of toxin-antitoxin stability system
MMKTLDVTHLGAEARQLIEAIERGDENEIVFVKDGQTIAKLVTAVERSSTVRLGLAKGMFKVPKDIDSDNAEIQEMFEGNEVRDSHE